MNLKIGLTGAQGTGKTTLSKALARELGLPLIDEQARIAIKEFGLENDCFRSTNPHYQREMDFLARCFLQMVTPGTCKVVTISGPVEERLRTAVHWAKVIPS